MRRRPRLRPVYTNKHTLVTGDLLGVCCVRKEATINIDYMFLAQNRYERDIPNLKSTPDGVRPLVVGVQR